MTGGAARRLPAGCHFQWRKQARGSLASPELFEIFASRLPPTSRGARPVSRVILHRVDPQNGTTESDENDVGSVLTGRGVTGRVRPYPCCAGRTRRPSEQRIEGLCAGSLVCSNMRGRMAV